MLKKLLDYRPIIVGWIWIALIPPAFLWWSEAIWFIVAMSLYANIEASFSTHASKKAEREQQKLFDEMRRELDEILRAVSGTDEPLPGTHGSREEKSGSERSAVRPAE